MKVWKTTMLTRAKISVYPKIVQKIITPKIWKLKDEDICELYTKNTKEEHLEIGAGPIPKGIRKIKNVEYMDKNYDIIEKMGGEIGKERVHWGDLLYEWDYPNKKYDSISCFNVMHCVPEKMKWNKFFYNTNTVLNDSGIVFGCYVKNTTIFSRMLNIMGIFHNTNDCRKVIENASHPFFENVVFYTIGHCDIFVFRKRNFT